MVGHNKEYLFIELSKVFHHVIDHYLTHYILEMIYNIKKFVELRKKLSKGY